MKINVGMLAKLLGRIVVAAPAIIAAVKPVVDTVKQDKAAQPKAD